MKTEKTYLVGTHRYAYKAGEAAEIIGVEMVSDERQPPRPCFRLRYQDGSEDYAAIFNGAGSCDKNPFYEIITEDDVLNGRIPPVSH